MLSSRAKNSINIGTEIDTNISTFEKSIILKAKNIYKEMNEKYPVCQFPLSEQQYPCFMGKHGFKNITTDYLAINLTPDNDNIKKELAMDIIKYHYQSQIEQINCLINFLGDVYAFFSKEELEQWKKEIKNRQKQRIKKYNDGEKLWETSVSIIMILRGEKT
jgi:hypothetical protein